MKKSYGKGNRLPSVASLKLRLNSDRSQILLKTGNSGQNAKHLLSSQLCGPSMNLLIACRRHRVRALALPARTPARDLHALSALRQNLDSRACPPYPRIRPRQNRISPCAWPVSALLLSTTMQTTAKQTPKHSDTILHCLVGLAAASLSFDG